MREIKELIIHCSDTPADRHVTVDEIRRWHVRENGWEDIGYHFVIYLDGTIHLGRPLWRVGAHCLGHNINSVGIAYVGGRGGDTRTPVQIHALRALVAVLKSLYDVTVHGHNEFSNKTCPGFNVKTEL